MDWEREELGDALYTVKMYFEKMYANAVSSFCMDILHMSILCFIFPCSFSYHGTPVCTKNATQKPCLDCAHVRVPEDEIMQLMFGVLLLPKVKIALNEVNNISGEQ
jgi:hypothetical protein